MNSKHVAHAVVAHDSEKYINRHETTSERYVACSNNPVLKIPQHMYSIYVNHITYLKWFSSFWLSQTCIQNMWNIHVEFRYQKLTILRGITIIGATSERLITFSNIPRSENAPAYVLCLCKSYYTFGILLWLPIVSNMHPQYIKDNIVIKTK